MTFGSLTRLAPAALCACALLAAGCGDGEESTPQACRNGESAFLDALRAAPGDVALAGGVPISSCLVENQSGGELSEVGAALVTVATRLHAEGVEDPAGPAPARLGYLIGAVRKGAEETGGIHTDLVRRLESAAELRPDGGLPARFRHAYDDGVAAGGESG